MKIRFAFLACLLSSLTQAQELVIHSVPQSVVYTGHNDDFTVRVRQPGGVWRDLFEYAVQVDMDHVRDASMVFFDFSGSVEVAVTKNNGMVQTARIRPVSYGIQPKLEGNTVFFTLTQARKLSVEINGDKLQNLHIFANPLETSKPDPQDPTVIYFGPGIHTPPDKPGEVFSIPSGKTVYIDGGAIIRGKLVCDKVKDVRIIGRGIIEGAQRGIEITHSTNIEIDGVIIKNPQHYTLYGGESSKLTIRNLKSFSCKSWSDGIDLMSCSDVIIDDVFMRNSDDCIAIYGHRWNYYGNARNITVKNSTLWADIAHPATMGLHGTTTHAGDTIENITFTNIDVLEHDEDDPNYQGCFAINAGDLNLVRNIRYENIRVEDFEEGQLLNLRVVYNEKYNTGPGRNIENVYFKNVSYNGTLENPSIIAGLGEKGLIKDVTFENLTINGKVILNAAAGHIQVDKWVQGVKFKR